MAQATTLAKVEPLLWAETDANGCFRIPEDYARGSLQRHEANRWWRTAVEDEIEWLGRKRKGCDKITGGKPEQR
jgi:hypothetical protein